MTYFFPKATDEQLLTPLHLACSYDQVEVVKVLLANDANIRCAGEKLQTPLHKAASVGSLDIVELLTTAANEKFGIEEVRQVLFRQLFVVEVRYILILDDARPRL